MENRILEKGRLLYECCVKSSRPGYAQSCFFDKNIDYDIDDRNLCTITNQDMNEAYMIVTYTLFVL